MKKIKNILILLLAVFAVSCIEKEPNYQDFPTKDVDFTFSVDGEQYSTDFYYVSTLKFINISSKTGTVTWDFATGYDNSNGEYYELVRDDETLSNPNVVKVRYNKAGKYLVTLDIDGVGSRSYPVQVMDIAPVLSVVNTSDSLVYVNTGWVELGIELPNPAGLECEYTWTFPAGTMKENGEEITTFVGENPGKLKFKNLGSQKITLNTRFDVKNENRTLAPSYANVQIASSIEAPTLYYAVYGGNIWAYKMLPESALPEGTKNMPYNMGVSSGVTPQQIVFASTKDGDFIYILDCGKKFTYQNDTDGVLGDGKITVMSADGTYANTVITNVGGHAFSDPFSGIAVDTDKDGYHDNLLYNDRNTGFNSIPLTTRGAVETHVNSAPDAYYCSNSSLGYYNKGIAYGAVHSGLQLDSKGVYYWPKSYNATGVFRFKAEHIGSTDVVPTSVLLNSAMPKAFILDEARGHMYVWHTGGAVGEGFCQYPLVAFEETLTIDQFTTMIKMDAADTAGSSVEALHVSQFAVDSANGNVYFGFNAESGEAYTTGIKYFDYATSTIKDFEGNTDKVFGICINPRATKLF